MDISIIIINYRTPDLCENCIASIRSAMKSCEYSYEIILVDNCSNDGQYERLLRMEDSITHIYTTERNGGFGYGNNYGFKNSSGRYLFFLNSDTILHFDILSEMIDYMEKTSDVGVLSCLMKDGEGKPLVVGHSFENMRSLFLQTIIKPLTPEFVRKKRGKAFVKRFLTMEQDCDWVSGAGMLIERGVFQRSGGWNESFFMYMEDEELCYRIHQMGYSCKVYPKIGITHLVGKSGGSAFSAYERYRSKILYYRLTDSKYFWINKHLIFLQARQYMRNLSSLERKEVIMKLREYCNE